VSGAGERVTNRTKETGSIVTIGVNSLQATKLVSVHSLRGIMQKDPGQ
jgi:hypothetical protein